jgi:hypothetical protein
MRDRLIAAPDVAALIRATLLCHSGSRGTRLSGIHTPDGGYGFSDVQLHIKARGFGAPRNDERGANASEAMRSVARMSGAICGIDRQ